MDKLSFRVSELCFLASNTIDTIIERYKGDFESTQSMITGTAYHSYFLRKDKDKTPRDLEILHYDNYKTKAAQFDKKEALKNNKTPLLAYEWSEIKQNAQYLQPALDKILSNVIDYELELKGNLHTLDLTGHIDCVTSDSIVDLKISTQTNKDLDYIIFDSAYQLQLYLYANLLKQNYGSGLDSKIYNNLKLVFINPKSLTIQVKHFETASIIQECDYLIKGALEKYQKFLESKKEPLIFESEYNIPQSAYYKVFN